MKNFVTILVFIVSALTILGAEAAPKCNVVFGPSKNAFKKNLAQDYCSIFKKGGSKAGKLKQADGTQIRTGICSNTPQGEIPTSYNMPSTLIVHPMDGQEIMKNKPFKIRVESRNIDLGFFSDPLFEYNARPQELNKHGLIKGHQHVTIQYLGTKKDCIFPDANIFSFFKGLNEEKLETFVDEGLPKKGIYRICTIISSFTHQALVLPIAQRGTSDDCIRIKVV